MQAHSPSTVSFIFGIGSTTAVASVIAVLGYPDLPQRLWSQEAAGWAQAAGTLFAILATWAFSTIALRRSKEAEERLALKKAKALSHFFVPALRTIEADVADLSAVVQQYQNIGIRNLHGFDLANFRFRPISSVDLILENAHNFPNELSVTIPQLLGFRAITDVNLIMLTERAGKTGYIDGNHLKPLLKWLELMRTLLKDIYRDMPSVHD